MINAVLRSFLHVIKLTNTGIFAAISGMVFTFFSTFSAPLLGQEYVVRQQPVYDLKSLFAVVRTVDITQARARIGGTLVELAVDEGDMVEAGQRLAVVRDQKQKLQIAALESKLRSLQAQLQLAQITLGRIDKLHSLGKISKSKSTTVP